MKERKATLRWFLARTMMLRLDGEKWSLVRRMTWRMGMNGRRRRRRRGESLSWRLLRRRRWQSGRGLQ